MPEQSAPTVTDTEIEEILETNEAGIGDLMIAYESVARHYYGAITTPHQTAVITSYASDTSAT